MAATFASVCHADNFYAPACDRHPDLPYPYNVSCASCGASGLTECYGAGEIDICVPCSRGDRKGQTVGSEQLFPGSPTYRVHKPNWHSVCVTAARLSGSVRDSAEVCIGADAHPSVQLTFQLDDAMKTVGDLRRAVCAAVHLPRVNLVRKTEVHTCKRPGTRERFDAWGSVGVLCDDRASLRHV